MKTQTLHIIKRFVFILTFQLFLSPLPLLAQADSQLKENIKPVLRNELINSEAGELSPVVTSDGLVLYFVRDGHINNKAIQDVWIASRSKNGNWEKLFHPNEPINNGINSCVFNVSPDGNQLLVRGAYDKGEFKAAGLSVISKNQKGEWDNPKKIEIENYADLANMGKYNGAFLCSNGKTILMYFTDELNEGKGDIYVSHLIEDERKKKLNLRKNKVDLISKTGRNTKWSPAEKAGNLNTFKYDEISPFLAADGVTLYFSSDRKGSIGSNDIWMCKRLDDTWKNWSEPVNLGNAINSEEWDCYYTMDARGETAYLVTFKNAIGASDIVEVQLKEPQRPEPVVLISGKVFNAESGEPLGAAIEYEDLLTGKNMGLAHSDPNSGEYKIVLAYGKNYGFMAAAENFASLADHVDLSTFSSYKEINRDLFLIPLKVGSTIRLNNIFFDFAKATLRQESFPELDRLVKFMSENPNVQIELSGHTDNVGSHDTNVKLSEDRAVAVKDYLVSKGIVFHRIMAVGYGETKPLNKNDSEVNKQINRRVEFTIIKNE